MVTFSSKHRRLTALAGDRAHHDGYVALPLAATAVQRKRDGSQEKFTIVSDVKTSDDDGSLSPPLDDHREQREREAANLDQSCPQRE